MVSTTFWVLPVIIPEKRWFCEILIVFYDCLQILQLTPHIRSYFIGKRKLHDYIWNQETEKCYLIMYPEWEKALVVLLTILIPFSVIPEQLHKFFMFLFFSLLTKKWCEKLPILTWNTLWTLKMMRKMIFKNRMKLHFPSSLPHVC